ncbi:hypothetical protein ABMA28_010261 [Loxostege sticticalis]|uniref:Carboxylic ester hydrolase n=1 Tax=Loxostege sticticalis TaxID=481309 RepID=A0ABD0SA96_LOXSC
MMLVILFACGLIGGIRADISKLVNLTQGPVLGYKANDAELFEFYGIPYATGPTGRDKFKEPLPAPVWTEILEAVDKDTVCPQFGSERLSDKTVKEDCLVANVFVPDTTTTNLPVMVWVHGGAFQMGHGNSGTPKQLVNSQRIIVVSFNYRVGPHGFLCLGTKDIPGNAGMKDQIALLRWVKENIKYFGGNPDDVTVAGCSAGGASVDLLLLSKMASGLFHRAIPMSGANVGVFGAQVDPIENAENYAKNINYDQNKHGSLEEFYKNVTLEQLNSYSLLETKDLAVVFSPCVERDIGGERFLDDTPVNIIRSSDYIQCPLLYGFANLEGLYRAGLFEKWKNEMNTNFEVFLPADLGFKNEDEKLEVAKKIKEFYFGDKLVSNETGLNYVEYFTDTMFVYAMQRSVTLQVQSGNNNIFLFVYSFFDESSQYVPFSDVQGATHCAESRAFMDEDESKMAPEYKIIQQKMREVVLDFITTGNPTPPGSSLPTWLPSGANRSPCMDFGATIQVAGPFEEKRMLFWDEIYEQYHRQPVPPYNSAAPFHNLISLQVVIFIFLTQYLFLIR